jgi:hypothetical protein
MPKTYNLTKGEVEGITRILLVAQMQEDILNSITQTYRLFVIDNLFKRLEIKPEEFKNAVVDVQNGSLVINDPVKPVETVREKPAENEVQK